MLKKIVAWSRLAFTPIALCFIGYLLIANSETLIAMYRDGRALNLVAVILLWMGIHLLSPVFTNLASRALGQPIAYRKALSIHIHRLPAKYIPGGIWHSVSRASDYHAVGMKNEQILRYLIIENLVLITVTLCLGGIVVITTEIGQSLAMTIGIVVALAGSALLLLPAIAQRIPVYGCNLLAYDYFLAVCSIVVYWSLAGISFAIFLKAFPSLVLASTMVQNAGIYVFSWGIGYLAVLAPQGLGVSEVVSGMLLDSGLGLEKLVVLLLGFRFLMLLADLLCWTILYVVEHVSASTDTAPRNQE